jgi:hypothetical protein
MTAVISSANGIARVAGIRRMTKNSRTANTGIEAVNPSINVMLTPKVEIHRMR